MQKTKINDFVEIRFSGYSEGKLFDSNIEEDLKKIDEKAKAVGLNIIIGEGMVVKGLDKALEDKEFNKEYEIELQPNDAFGDRKKEFVRTIPLKMFLEKKINPAPGMVFAIDNSLAKIIAVSGARVVTDFNSPLAGKNVKYKFRIERKIEDESDKIKVLFEKTFRFVPEFEIKEDIIIKGRKEIEFFANAFNDKFLQFIGKKIKVEIKEEAEK